MARNQRVLVTTLTKRMAEDLSEYYADLGVKVRYLHGDVDTLERTEIIRDLRRGVYDVLVGINLLREGLDLPEVSLVAILDADKEGFLRARRSLLQTSGRAARNVDGRVIMYADRVTDSMRACIDETERRRVVQAAYNETHGIVPRTVVSPITSIESAPPRETKGKVSSARALADDLAVVDDDASLDPAHISKLTKLRKQMRAAASDLRFEDAAALRDRVKTLEMRALELPSEVEARA